MGTIIGVHMGHDASLSILEDGCPVFCLSEERLTREKLYYGFPLRSLKLALEWLNKSPAEIDILAIDTLELPGILGPDEMAYRFNSSTTKKITKKFMTGRKVLEYFFGKKVIETQRKNEAEAIRVREFELGKLGFTSNQLKIYDHHLSHAASAFWASPFERALIVTSDGRGDGKSATMYYGNKNQIIPILSVSDLDSVGQFYSAVTFYLGFRPNRHEGKITGLAAHGDKMLLGPKFLQCVLWKQNGSYTFQIPEKYRVDSVSDFDEQLNKLSLSLKDRIILHSQGDINVLLTTTKWYGLLAYLNDVVEDASKEDIAAGVQYLAEEVTTKLVKNHLPDHDIPVTLAGGVFANVRINQKIREISGVNNVYIQPAMGDQGLSLGAALLAFAENDENATSLLKRIQRPSQLNDVYLGPVYSNGEIINACQEAGVNFQKFLNIEGEIGRWIHEGLIIGYYQGRMEFGPRALGHRSILARPIEGEINEKLNYRLKRTEFMPFAPSILSEFANQYFIDYKDDHVASEYMTMTYDIPKELQDSIPAVVHVDGTARPHVVHINKEPIYHKIISAYHQLSGIPVIINTSFNIHEEPIVCTPQDAIRSFKAGCVDILVLEDLVVGMQT